ncbi:MAG TPA: TonB-dependent receptor [Hyphomonadaceae bacterium]|nr:TonB-dependent receptor [Hyphomonadaceae bacterium]
MSKRLPARFNPNRTATLVALCLGLHCQAAMSQETNEQAEDELYEQILITASKRSTGLQETPIAVSVTSGEAIEQTQVLDIQDLQALVPTLRVNPLQRSANTNFSIRGFGNGANNTGIEPSVGVFIDGVYRSRAASQIGDLPRVQQVEVLSGPQSTLFGKNASAGVISIRTQGPSFTEEGKLTLGVGNYNQRLLKGYYTNGITEELAFSLSGGVNKRDGYTESVVDGVDKLNNRDRWNIRGQALYEPSTDVKFRFIADYSEIDERCCTVADVINGPTTAVVRALGGTVLETDDPFAFKSALNFNPSNTVEDGGVSLQIDVDFDTFTLTSITAYRNNKSDYFADVDYTSLDILTEEGHTEIDTFTQELRLVSTTDGPFNWIVGAFYSNSESAAFSAEYTPNYDTYAINTLGFTFLEDHPNDLEYFSQSLIELTESAFFGEIGYDITDRWSVTLGGRYYDYELKEFSAVDFPLFDQTFNEQTLDQIRANSFDPTLGQSDDGFLYKFNTSYQFTDDILGYFTVAEGYRIGNSNGLGPCPAFDPNATQGACALAPGQQYGPNPGDVAQFDERAYGPDQTTSYELGAKTTWLDGDLILNGAIFFVEWTDPQVSSATVNANIPITVNAAGAESKGLELQGSWQVNDQFSLRGSFSHAATELTEDVPFLIRTITPPGFGTAFEDGQAGDRLPGSPENQFAIFGEYVMPLASGNEVTVRGGYNWQGDILTRTGGRGSSLTVPDVGLANASVTYAADNWDASLYVNNLFDEYVITGYVGTPLSAQVASDINGDPVTVRNPYATIGAPRTVGVRFRYFIGE